MKAPRKRCGDAGDKMTYKPLKELSIYHTIGQQIGEKEEM
jgi:hypothetical protein